jgi:acetate kinase
VQHATLCSPPVPRVLVVNTGSSSLKWDLLDAQSEQALDHGDASWKGDDYSADIEHALQQVQAVDAVAHRVVHGGSRYVQSIVIDDEVLKGISELSQLAPLHNPPALIGIDAAKRVFANVPHVACFDTAFHATLPQVAHLYPLPWEWTERWELRRFGFHGLSVQYAAGRVAELLGAMPGRLAVCHLGAGSSITAVADGRSVDTSMGFTPLEGLMMARRSGSVDPGLLLYLLRSGGISVDELDHGLNFESGLLGVSGVSGDLREIVAAGTERAELAIEMFIHRAAFVLGGMIASLGGLDALVFTGGIGEHSARIRAGIAARFGYLGLLLDDAANERASSDAEVSAGGATVGTFVLTAREDLAMLREVKRLLWSGR